MDLLDKDFGIAERGRHRWSNFHITINTNRNIGQLGGWPNAAAGLNGIIDAVNDTIENWQVWLMQYVERTQVPFIADNAALIRNIRARVGLERGNDNNQLHAHIVLEVEHDTRVQISRDGLIDAWQQAYGRRPASVYIRLLTENEDLGFLLDYIMKQAVPYNQLSEVNQRLYRVLHGAAVDEAVPLFDEE